MRATDLLKRQQDYVRALFPKLELGRAYALKDLSRLLVAQLAVERELFYPAVMHLAQNEVLDAWDNHSLALKALSRTLAARRHGKTFKTRVEILKSLVLGMMEAEQRSVLSQAEDKLSSERLEALGLQMEARFYQQLKRLWEKDYLSTPRRRTQLTHIARRVNQARLTPGEPEFHFSRVA